jgi:hypothetical protein
MKAKKKTENSKKTASAKKTASSKKNAQTKSTEAPKKSSAPKLGVDTKSKNSSTKAKKEGPKKGMPLKTEGANTELAPKEEPLPRKKTPTQTDSKNVERFDVKGTCRVIGCNSPATTAGYSRTCYIKYWKQIKQKEEILRQGILDRYLRELVDKYPDRVLLAIRHDLSSEEAYAQMIRELDLYGGIDELEHESQIIEDEAEDSIIDDIKKDIGKEEDLF